MKLLECNRFRTAEAARFLGMSVTSLRKKSDTGEIPCKILGRNRYFIRSELIKWQENLKGWAEDGNTAEGTGKMDRGLQVAPRVSE